MLRTFGILPIFILSMLSFHCYGMDGPLESRFYAELNKNFQCVLTALESDRPLIEVKQELLSAAMLLTKPCFHLGRCFESARRIYELVDTLRIRVPEDSSVCCVQSKLALKLSRVLKEEYIEDVSRKKKRSGECERPDIESFKNKLSEDLTRLDKGLNYIGESLKSRYESNEFAQIEDQDVREKSIMDSVASDFNLLASPNGPMLREVVNEAFKDFDSVVQSTKALDYIIHSDGSHGISLHPLHVAATEIENRIKEDNNQLLCLAKLSTSKPTRDYHSIATYALLHHMIDVDARKINVEYALACHLEKKLNEFDVDKKGRLSAYVNFARLQELFEASKEKHERKNFVQLVNESFKKAQSLNLL